MDSTGFANENAHTITTEIQDKNLIVMSVLCSTRAQQVSMFVPNLRIQEAYGKGQTISVTSSIPGHGCRRILSSTLSTLHTTMQEVDVM
ncbi:hypothetical protein NPIL_682051 [Nephila pilipes]|uniref:Uncharacterized protein n=1 Tax=Nephila pilipes TaxID=299642 RepID=A0A8X6TUC0_NEPPI|nr:hypothetical protein NPIL_682051 [Nephila pilipes]